MNCSQCGRPLVGPTPRFCAACGNPVPATSPLRADGTRRAYPNYPNSIGERSQISALRASREGGTTRRVIWTIVILALVILVLAVALGAFKQAPATKPQAITDTAASTKPATSDRASPRSYKVRYRTGPGNDTMNVRYATSTGFEQLNNVYLKVFNESPKTITMQSGQTAEIELMVRNGGYAKCSIVVNGLMVSENAAQGAGAVAYCAAYLP